MSDRRNGLYYESKDIRNAVLLRNIGEYSGYKYSMLYNGGLAIGMPYAVETELVPYTLAEKSSETGLRSGKKENPNINSSFKEGGLFGYTHEVINSESDWISRSKNITESYYDYDSTEEMLKKLDSYPHSLPWGQGNDDIFGSETMGLRAFSSHNSSKNSVFYNDYTEYVRDIFTNGVSFDKKLGEHYIDNLFYDGFSRETIDTGVVGFIDEKAGFITDDIDELKGIEDTKLGHIGRILLEEEKVRQTNGIASRRLADYYFNYVHTPITFGYSAMLGLGTGNEFSYMPGVSVFNLPRVSFRRFILDENEALGGSLDLRGVSFQEDLLRRHLRRNKYINFSLDGGYGEVLSYAGYFNVRDNGSITYSGEYGEYDENRSGDSTDVFNFETFGRSMAGDSVEGFFHGSGVYDANIEANEHYDEQDGINEGERDVLSRKDSYNEPERLGLSNDIGFSSSENSLLDKTKRLFEH